MHRLLWKLIYWKCRRVVCISNYIKDRAASASGDATKLTVIYNYPPARIPVKKRLQLTKPSGEVAIVFLGQISKEKGIEEFFRAAIELIHRNFKIVCWIAGESEWQNPLAQRLINEAMEAGLADRIVFLGYVDDVQTLLAKADIHACPSVWNEPLTNVILEAKSAGIPTVAFPVGGIPELIEHKIDGFLCRAATTEALIEGLEYFVGNAEARTIAGKKAQLSLERNFGFPRFQRQWVEVFRDTMTQC